MDAEAKQAADAQRRAADAAWRRSVMAQCPQGVDGRHALSQPARHDLGHMRCVLCGLERLPDGSVITP